MSAGWTEEEGSTLTYRYLKLEIFIPESHLEILKKTLRDCDAGHIGRYASCLSVSRVTSTWRPLAGTHPFLGKEREISEEPEIKAEVTIRAEQLKEVLKAVRRVHPYEEPVINVVPLLETGL